MEISPHLTSPPAYMRLINTSLHICGVPISIKSKSKSTYPEIQESILVVPPKKNYSANMTSMLALSHQLELKLSSSNQEQIKPPPTLITESMAGKSGLTLINFETIKFMRQQQKAPKRAMVLISFQQMADFQTLTLLIASPQL